MKFVLDKTFRPTFYGSSNQIFILDAFEYSFIQHLVFHYCVEYKTYAVECNSNVFIDIRISIICGVPQKFKRSGHKQDKREEAKMASKKEKDSNEKKIGPTMRFSCLWACSTQTLGYGTCITLIIPTVGHKYSLNKN